MPLYRRRLSTAPPSVAEKRRLSIAEGDLLLRLLSQKSGAFLSQTTIRSLALYRRKANPSRRCGGVKIVRMTVKEGRRGNYKWLYLEIKISPAGLLENPKPGDVVELVIATPEEWAECRKAAPQQSARSEQPVPQPQSQPAPPLPPMLADNQWVKALRARPLYDRKAGGWASEA